MKIALCYIAVTAGPITMDYCARFVSTWQAFPPGHDHDTFILCNGGPLSTELALVLSPLKPRLYPRQNDNGWDISAYIDAARNICAGYDAMLCLGESCHFHRAGWLARLVDAWTKHGPGMYGPFSSFAVRPHLNTTAFMCPPDMLASYPVTVNNRATRYQFEHGTLSLWRLLAHKGKPVRLVTWDGDWPPMQWRQPPNILWRGNQTNCLLWCNHSEGYANADPETKVRWERKTNIVQ